jgi:asparagine synthase (glutamine-hydrolysing)
MCGIAGLLKQGVDHQSLDATAAEAAVARMVDALRHRGPDGTGLHIARNDGSPSQAKSTVVLGHTRLAIIDLSTAGRQPMTSPDGQLTITFNGEIYNFKQLRDQLGAEGWRSRSDTEVILRAYARWGADCVHRLRGMFAFAVWDASRQQLFLARDRVGIKPLYYSAQTSTGPFLFASEVRALLASGLVPPRIDPLGLADYLAYQSLPAPRTLIEGVYLLPPGQRMLVSTAGDVQQDRYWDLLDDAASSASQATEADGQRRVAELLREAIAVHLVSDVPVAAFLSGGIDSSAVVALMREAGHVPRTFSVAFAEQMYDEAPHARAVAERFRTEHTEIRLSESNLLEQLPDALAAMDQPTGDGINTYVVSRAVRTAGIKVALSGLGGDELFAGYPSFVRLQRASRLLGIWGRGPRPVRRLAAHALQVLGASSIGANKTAALVASDGRLASLYPPLRQVLSRGQRQRLLQPEWAAYSRDSADPYVGLLQAAFDAQRPDKRNDVLSRVSYAEARTYMHDVLLRDTDQMSMAGALEVRVPLLDHVLMEYVIGLPDRHKQPNGMPKRLFVESLGGLLPESIVRRPKQGFALPFEPWMRGELRSFCAHRLGPERLGGRGMFQPQGLRELWQGFLEGQRNVSWSRVWLLVVLEEWLSRHVP